MCSVILLVPIMSFIQKWTKIMCLVTQQKIDDE